ncbi:Flagellar hook-basal body complex protein FliE [[Clostridium] ultunense Esp]|uniref:Flagellar hook-basal body complex protein FliE n=1 Tax=[Clostridium] ultunense Esp TaxID=1288971 RepID=M1ZGS6_9FIRM|nr:flagellar hook-basal body complex protein FliE [Schnuerera ultunensis]CCQ97483.1 Flagellar hook-basal body complex protein FliE [[Clostridium] ultunense Esp]SHD77008.1 Flagellar hook-basal body complex protein FliE [[Clostridium] ultunense Esp]
MEIKTIGLNNHILPNDGLNGDFESKNDNQFSLFLNKALDRVNELQLESDEYKRLLITGDVDNLHDVAIAQEKANISLQLTLSIRNKVVEAYREIMRMQI